MAVQLWRLEKVYQKKGRQESFSCRLVCSQNANCKRAANLWASGGVKLCPRHFTVHALRNCQILLPFYEPDLPVEICRGDNRQESCSCHVDWFVHKTRIAKGLLCPRHFTVHALPSCRTCPSSSLTCPLRSAGEP